MSKMYEKLKINKTRKNEMGTKCKYIYKVEHM